MHCTIIYLYMYIRACVCVSVAEYTQLLRAHTPKPDTHAQYWRRRHSTRRRYLLLRKRKKNLYISAFLYCVQTSNDTTNTLPPAANIGTLQWADPEKGSRVKWTTLGNDTWPYIRRRSLYVRRYGVRRKTTPVWRRGSIARRQFTAGGINDTHNDENTIGV